MSKRRDIVSHASYQFAHDSDYFYLKPENITTNQVLLIDRLSESASLHDNVRIPAEALKESRSVYAIVGRIRLPAGSYLVLVVERHLAARFDGHDIWRLKRVEMLAYQRSLLHLTEQQIEENLYYQSMIQQVLDTEHYYFSPTCDLTQSYQRRHLSQRSSDQRFVWNRHLLLNLQASATSDIGRYLTVLLHGFIGVETLRVGDASTDVQYALISRRSVERAGTRLNVRGVNEKGEVANFIETEAVLLLPGGGELYSFVQTRGSIPLFWSQKPNLR